MQAEVVVPVMTVIVVVMVITRTAVGPSAGGLDSDADRLEYHIKLMYSTKICSHGHVINVVDEDFDAVLGMFNAVCLFPMSSHKNCSLGWMRRDTLLSLHPSTSLR